MATFSKQKGKVALDYASTIKSELYGEPYYCNFADVFCVDEDVLELALKPSKWTLLHDYIEYSVLDGISYSLKKSGSEAYDEIYNELDAYDIIYKNHDTYKGNDFHHYLYRIHAQKICPELVPNIFNILFSDREVMRRFNLVISESIKKLNYSDWPNHLKRDGVLKRNTYWPEWLRSALFRREQGHCANCQKDLTGLLSNNRDIAIDHIVPLNMGGTNDSTNFQILCSKCNADKGGDNTNTSDLYSAFW